VIIFCFVIPGEEANNLDLSPDSGINDLQNLSPEEQEKQKAEWTQELARVRDCYVLTENVSIELIKQKGF
jgi:hypothetical protein